MRERVSYLVALFPSASDALRAEKALNRRGIAYKLIPVPRHLSPDCGVSLRFEAEHLQAVEEAFVEDGIRIEGIHHL